MGKVKVTNRSAGPVIYSIPERHLRREFAVHETKELDESELAELAMVPGGRNLIYNFLLIQDQKVVQKILNVHEEPEYWLTEDKIPTWMTTCSLDEFKDALDFAPEGVKKLIMQYAVSIPLNDVSKREAIMDQLGFDVNKAIENNRASQEEDIESAPATSRRRTAPTYKVNNTTTTKVGLNINE